MVVCAALLLAAKAGQCQDDRMLAVWRRDFGQQALAARPKIEARYADATRTGFEIIAQDYRIGIDLAADTGQRIRSISSRGRSGSAEVLAGSGGYLQLVDASGNIYSSLNSKKPSRVNIYRRGPYYIETHWLDVLLTDENGIEVPVKGEVIFYSYPEKTHVGVVLRVVEPLEAASASLVLEFDAEACASMGETMGDGPRLNDFCLVRRRGDSPTVSLIYPVPRGVDEVTMEKTNGAIRVSNFAYSSESRGGAAAKWDKGHKATAYLEMLPLPSSDASPRMEAEVDPLLSGRIVAGRGRSLGYDPIRGCYTVQTDNPGNFSYHYYENPNAYEVATFSITNNDLPRKVYILHETRTNPGSVECGVVLDEQGDTLPIMVQISKNFAGEKEEPFYNPGDTPFSETIFPLHLEADECRTLTSLHLYQNWGTHPLKQFSSLGAWMDYYHMSTGVTETTCYVPFLFGGLDGVSIADLRPMSQRMWESQPQHDNVAGHSFLRYRDAQGLWHFVEYTGTTFRSTGPNWADMSMSYLSDDGKAKVTLDVFELPQTDELRNFIRMRVDILEDIPIRDGDLARNVRLLNIASWVQRMRYTHVAYGGASGEPTVVPIKLDDGFTLAGAPLPAANGFATIYPDKRGANAYIVRRFEGKIGGQDARLGVSVIGQKDGNTILMLVPVTSATRFEAGDYLEIDLFIMPYGGGTQDWKPARKAAFDFGQNAPRVTQVTAGAKLSDFPTRVALDQMGRAEFALAGGMNYIPIIIEGAKDYRGLRLYRADGEKTLVEHSRTGAEDGYQVFARDDGTFGFVFLVETDGSERRYVVE